MKIQVLGSGCANCSNTVALIEQVAKRCGKPVAVEKVRDMREIALLGVMSTPAVAIDGRVVHAGGVPTAERVEEWLLSPKH